MTDTKVGCYISHSIQLLASSILTLFVVDVLVNLGLDAKVVRDQSLVVDWGDFIGLFQAEVPIAFLCTLAGLSLGALISLLLRDKSPIIHALFIISGGLSCLSVLSGIKSVWNVNASRLSLALSIAIGTGFLVWLTLGFLMARPTERSARLGVILSYIMLPSLLLAFLNLCIGRLWRPDATDRGLVMIWTLLIIGVTVVAFRSRHASAKLALGVTCPP